MIDVKIVGKVIKQCRQKRNITQEVFSGFAGLDRTHYSKIERGLRMPNLETIFKIAEALDMAPGALVQLIDMALQAEQKNSAGKFPR